MPEEYMNIYKAARRAAGFTQEHAAELLGVSVRSVADYETGQRLPPNDVVDRMSHRLQQPSPLVSSTSGRPTLLWPMWCLPYSPAV